MLVIVLGVLGQDLAELAFAKNQAAVPAGGRRGCQGDYAVNVKGITPGAFTAAASPGRVHSGYLVIFLVISQFLRRAAMKTALRIGRINLTIAPTGRRHGPARING